MALSKKQIHALGASGLVDEQWYLDRYRDVGLLELGAAEHYLRIGAHLQRDPGPKFNTAYYLAEHADVAAAGLNPLLHYIAHGRKEGRSCVPEGKLCDLKVQGATESSLPVRSTAGLRSRDPEAKTILVCAHVAGPKLFGGERSLLDVVEGLSALGYNLVVVLPGAGHVDYFQALREHSVAVLSFRYAWWRKDVEVSESVVAAFARIIEEHAVDAVHANTIMLREPLLAARRMGIPAVAHVRELITHDVALCETIGEEPQEIVEKVLEGADWVMANSKATARCFAKQDATQVVHNTVEAKSFDIAPPCGSDTIRVGLISSNLPKKGIFDFIEVAQILEHKLPDVRFVLIGPDNDHTALLKQRQAAGELSPHLVFAGYRHSPVDAISEVDIVLNLSHFQESFGRTVLEAMAGRRPTVVYDWGALPELVREGETGHIVPFRDIAAVAARLEELCTNPDRVRSMGAAARERMLALFDRPHFIQSLRVAYDGIFEQFATTPLAPLVLPARNGAGREDDKAPQKLKIAYFLWHFPVPSETFVLNELRILVSQGHDVRVFCRQSPHKDFQPDFPIEWTQVESPGDLSQKLLDAGCTIVHSHFTYPTVTEMVWPACEQAQIPFTFIAHAQDIFRHRNDEKNKIGQIGQSPLCLRVLVPSRFHRDYVENRGVPADKLLINPNGIDPDLYIAGQDPERAARRRRSICAIHRFTAKKGLEYLIEAGAQLAADGVSIHLYGYGELEEEYRALIAKMGLGNVHIHGPVQSRDEMLEIFRQHDLFACPSIRAADGDMDGIPTVLMEAMASGLPVLATAISGIPDLVKDGNTGIVCESTAASIAAAVHRFYSLPDVQVEAMIEDAEALIRAEFNAARLTATLVRLWQRRTLDLMIVSWNNLSQLQEVMRRLHKYTSLPYHLLVCDNGSGAEVIAHLCQQYADHDNVTVILNRDNVFVGPGTNICLQHGNSDYAVYVCGKEGFVLDHGWEKGLVEYMDTNPDVGLAGTLCHSPSYLTGAAYPEGVALFSKFRNREFVSKNADRRFGHVQGGFFILRRAMYEGIGGFSDEVPHSYTDVEYSFYVESMGWKLGSPPRLLALFNKTRPGLFSRMDERVLATHPPVLADLPLLDRMVRNEVVHCNVCGWHGNIFMSGDGEGGKGEECPGCGSLPVDRTLYRYLAESMLTYRRLPALGVNVGDAMSTIWRQQFQGEMLSAASLRERLGRDGSLDFKPESLKLVYLNDVLDGGDADKCVLHEVDRLLASDGMFIFRSACTELDADTVSDACRLHGVERARFSSCVVCYDKAPLFVGRRSELAQCVS